jgi:protein-S-isoprenylcysteine O-methyltransferase Ste14
VSDASAKPVAQRSCAALVARSLLGGSWFALWFFVAFPAGLLQLCGESLIPPAGANRAIGVALIAAAHLVLVALVARFVRQGAGTQIPLDPPKRMIAQGLYARVRNPMYTTYLVIALGEAVLYRSWILLVYMAALGALFHLYVVGVEEKKLRARFGDAYERYCETAGRWLPRR